MDRITVISDNPEAEGIGFAKKCNVGAGYPRPSFSYPDRESFDRALAEKIDACQPKLIALAGFMRILSDAFVQRYQGRLMNIHPSLLLQRSQGLKTHPRPSGGIKIHGCTVHIRHSSLIMDPL